jgi:hypothetical protein
MKKNKTGMAFLGHYFICGTFRYKDMAPQNLKKCVFHKISSCKQHLHHNFALKS